MRGVEAAIELYKDPEYGTGIRAIILSFHSGFSSIVFRLIPRQPQSRNSLGETCGTIFSGTDLMT